MKNKTTISLTILLLLLNTIFTTAMESKKEKELILKYLVRLPKNPIQKAPVIILLHGVGSNEQDLFRYADEFPQHIVIAVRAPFELSLGSYTWFQVQFIGDKRVINEVQAEKSRTILNQFINEIVERYTADSTNITLLGFSQGAVMAYSVSLTCPEKVRNIGVLGGRILEEVKPLINTNDDKLKLLNIFMGHGIYDTMMPINYADSAYEYCTKLACNIQYKKYPIEHTISTLEMEDFKNWLEIK
jgi:phospholipase/carboxylesterase